MDESVFVTSSNTVAITTVPHYSINTAYDQVEFNRNFLDRVLQACSSRSRTGASQSSNTDKCDYIECTSFLFQLTSWIHIDLASTPTRACFVVAQAGISIVTVNTKEYHSDVLAIITRIMRRTF
ncbi:hypothetical protein Tco_0978061 [Tanacetum coccineum]|uniref:Uncharacterized protein n=1 Tax=Tanacetum coccineum TaxID=301880 RepID=A0ABQ5ELV5_9ASTR